MKRAGNLWGAILERENLVRAFHQAARGKRWKQEVRRFAGNLDQELAQLRASLIDRSFETGRYHVFEVHDPKRRTIHAARFPERVFHHALMNVCEPVLERQSIHHSYACRKGKGRLAAIAAAEKAARACPWHLKLDIRKYFESIPHGHLIARLHRVFKDPDVLQWLEELIRGHHGEEGQGLPIGSLTSQHLANFYLGPLDRFCHGHPAVKAYARYMDDFVCWGDDKAAMVKLGQEIRDFVMGELGLTLKHPPAPQPSARGMDFLGYRIFPSHTVLNRRSKLRYRRRLSVLAQLHANGLLAESQVQQRLTALTAFVLPARSHTFRCNVLENPWMSAIGHEPGEPGRQLGQQREQLPRREPQQQQPDEPEQQHRVPYCPQLRPIRMDVPAESRGLNRPPSRSGLPGGPDKAHQGPPAASRSVDSGLKAVGGSLLMGGSSGLGAGESGFLGMVRC
jgi:RNA-directed DNA polymerase